MDDFERFLAHLTQDHPEVAPDLLRRLARATAPPERPNTQERRLIRKLKEG